MAGREKEKSENRDPISGAPGAHPAGVGVGAAGGGAAGAAIGTAVGGPIGTAVGAVVGAIAGGYAGKGIAEAIDPTAEDAYWREQHKSQPYADPDRTYEHYESAYRTGYQGHDWYEPGTTFQQAEPTLREDYERGSTTGGIGTTEPGAMSPPSTTGVSETSAASTGTTPLPWEHARPAAEAAWNRVERGESKRIPLSEEQIEVRKREIEQGAVRLRKVVKTETVQQPVELEREELVVERVPAGTEGAVPAEAFSEKEIRVPLKREEAEVSKTSHVAGEVRVSKNVERETRQVQETVRKEDVEVENEGEARAREERRSE